MSERSFLFQYAGDWPETHSGPIELRKTKKTYRAFFLAWLVIILSTVSFAQPLNNSLTACYSFMLGPGEPVNNLNGTVSSATLTADRASYPMSAYALSGSTLSYIELPNSVLIKPANDVSFSAWVRVDSVAPALIAFTRNTSTLNIGAYQLGLVTTTAGLCFQAGKANPTNYDLVTGTTAVVPGNWYHVAFTMNNISINLFVDGVQEATGGVSFLGYDYSPNANVYLGNSNDPLLNLPFKGCIDNVKFYNRAITAGEVTQLYNVDPSCTQVPLPNCSEVFYALDQNTRSVWACTWGIPLTISPTTLMTPKFANGLAIAPAFGFTAPNPTFWVEAEGTYWFHNGYYFENTGHSSQNASGMGGSQNYIFDISNSVITYSYNGTGSSTVMINSYVSPVAGPLDVIGDDLDNLYFLRTLSPPSLDVYNLQGNQICSYSITGIQNLWGGVGFAIKQNTVALYDVNTYYVGLINGNSINFTVVPIPPNGFVDFACCRLSTAFPSTVTASPINSVSCHNQTLTLTANSYQMPGSFLWSGPGIVGPNTGQSIVVNQAGLYSCSLTSCPGGSSYCVFNVLQGPVATTPTVTQTSSISCANPTAQLSVQPSSAPFSALWTGYGLNGALNQFSTSAVAAGTFSVSLTNTITNCSASATIEVLSEMPVYVSNSNICSGGQAIITPAGVQSATWAPGGTISNFLTVSPSISTVYTITGTTLSGCQLTGVAFVSVTPTPTLTTSSPSSTFCAGVAVSLGAAGAITYSWLPGSSTTATITVAPQTSTNYTVVGANGNCTTSTVVTTTVAPGPDLTPTAASPIMCNGLTNTLSASNAISYTWQPGNAGSASVAVSPSVSTIYTVSGTDGSGCISTSTLSMVVNPTPTVSIAPSLLSVCAGNSAILTANGASFYDWGSNSITISPAFPTVYSVTGYSLNCSATATVLVNVLPVPVVNAVSTVSAICLGFNNVLTASGNGQSYTWSPGGTISPSISVSPTTTINYSVTASGASGCTASAVVPVIVDTPTLITGPNGIGVCPGSTLSIFANGASTYTWSPINLQGASVVISPTVTSTYTVTGSSANGCTATATRLVYVLPEATVVVSASANSICLGSAVTMSVSGGVSYTWLPSGASQSVQSVTPQGTMVYTVVGSDWNNCKDTAYATVVVNPIPSVVAGAYSQTLCEGAATTLTVSGAESFTWQPGGFTTFSVLVSPIVNTIYTVTGTQGICSESRTLNISVYPNPIVTVENFSICSGQSATLTSGGASSYTWEPGGSVGSSLIVNPAVNSIYTVTGSSSVGCSSSAVSLVSVQPNPTLAAVASPSTLCRGQSATLSASGAQSYTWQPGGLLGAQVNANLLSSTIFSVNAESALGCAGTAILLVTVNPNPTLSIQSSASEICVGEVVTFTVSGASTYSWNGVAGGNEYTLSPVANVTLTVLGENAQGCVTTATQAQPVSLCLGLIDSNDNENDIVVYPNPTSGLITVSMPVNETRVVVSVVDLQGRILLSRETQFENPTIDLSEWTSGAYQLLIYRDSHATKRVLLIKN